MLPLAASHDQPPAVLNPEGDLQVVLIQVGDRAFGIPLSQISYVAPIPADFASRGSGVADYFVLEGEPRPYFSLWDILGLPSFYAEYEELQAMLPQRRQDHVDWMSALEHSIRTGAPFAKARNPRECAFGKWFYACRIKERRLGLLLRQFEQPHALIHALADHLLGMQEAGQGRAALQAFDEAHETTLAKLLALFDRTLQLVVELQRRIAVIVTDGDVTCALGADRIRDLADIPPERFRPDVRPAGGAAGRATAGLIILADQSVVPLLNWPAFCAGLSR